MLYSVFICNVDSVESSNLVKLRDYIKHVYVDRKYVGERNSDPLPPVKLVSNFSNVFLRTIILN